MYLKMSWIFSFSVRSYGSGGNQALNLLFFGKMFTLVDKINICTTMPWAPHGLATLQKQTLTRSYLWNKI